MVKTGLEYFGEKFDITQDLYIFIGMAVSLHAYFLLRGVNSYFERKTDKIYLILLPISVLLSPLAMALFGDLNASYLPPFIYSAGLFTVVGLHLFSFGHEKSDLAKSLGIITFLWGLERIAYPVIRSDATLSSFAFVIAGLLTFIVAVGVMFLYMDVEKRTLKNRLALVANCVNDQKFAVVISDVSSGKGLFMNRAALELYNITEKEVPEYSIQKLYGFVKGDKIQDLNLIRSGEKKVFYYDLITKASKVKNIEVSASITKIDENEILLALINDITDIKIIQKEQKNALAAVDNLFDIMPVPMFMEKVGSEIIEMANMSFCHVVGYTPEEIIGKSTKELNLWADDTQQEEIQEILLQNEKVYNRQISINSKNKAKLNMVLSACTIERDGVKKAVINLNEITQYIEIQNEIKRINSQLAEAKEKLEEANNIKGIIFRNLGHELRTPLNGALGFTSLLMREIEDPDQKEMMDLAHTSMKRLEKTLSSLMSLTALETDNQRLYITPVNLAAIVEMYYASLRDIYSKDTIEFRSEVRTPDIYALIDETSFNQVFFNIVDNAVKFTDGGVVTVGINTYKYEDKLWAEVSVADTGCGISRASISTVFQPFRQESEGIDRVGEGLGLGLSIVKKLMEMMNSQVLIESEKGVGTTVRLLFPIAKNPD